MGEIFTRINKICRITGIGRITVVTDGEYIAEVNDVDGAETVIDEEFAAELRFDGFDEGVDGDVGYEFGIVDEAGYEGVDGVVEYDGKSQFWVFDERVGCDCESVIIHYFADDGANKEKRGDAVWVKPTRPHRMGRFAKEDVSVGVGFVEEDVVCCAGFEFFEADAAWECDEVIV